MSCKTKRSLGPTWVEAPLCDYLPGVRTHIPEVLCDVIRCYSIIRKPLKTLKFNDVLFPLRFPLYYIIPCDYLMLIRAKARERLLDNTV